MLRTEASFTMALEAVGDPRVESSRAGRALVAFLTCARTRSQRGANGYSSRPGQQPREGLGVNEEIGRPIVAPGRRSFFGSARSHSFAACSLEFTSQAQG